MPLPPLSSLVQAETVVFDCGDTLLSLSPTREEICAEVLGKLGARVPVEQVSRAYARVDFSAKLQSSKVRSDDERQQFYREFNRLLASALGVESVGEELNEALQTAFADKRRWSPTLGVETMLDAVGATRSLYVMANWDKGLERVLTKTGLQKRFVEALCSEELGAEKPNPACFTAFFERTGVDPARALYVGNEYEADIVGSRRAGMTPVLVDQRGLYGGHVDCHYFVDWDSFTRVFVQETASVSSS